MLDLDALCAQREEHAYGLPILISLQICGQWNCEAIDLEWAKTAATVLVAGPGNLAGFLGC